MVLVLDLQPLPGCSSFQGEWVTLVEPQTLQRFPPHYLVSINKELKSRIEHFESIEEQFGLALQHFSAKVIDDNSLKLYCEVLALNDEVLDTSFTIEVAIYDLDYNIIHRDEISKMAWEFKGFEVFEFTVKDLEISVEEIGRIRFYPSK